MRSFFARLGQATGWGFGILTVGTVSGLLGVLAVVYALVYFGDDSNLKKSAILARINEETNIYMLDEETQIGSIFASAHRRYVPIDEVPAHMINAIIASEDKNFYKHHGVDPTAIISAGAGYLKGGRMRGASTLTQQTVRNILGWFEVSLSRKFKEWIGAMQLERLYSKRQILEFYLNQFYVSGNGNGIGIAARYYFNKDVRDLDLVESAFIAGSVKGPSAYDPFIKFTKERRERAIRNAYHRKNYVLRRMYEQGWISEAEFKEAWDKPVKFNRGRFRSEEVSLVHLIRQFMNKKEILEKLGIEDAAALSHAGLKIYTTIDPEMQKSAQLAVRRNLARLDTVLKGFKPEKEELFRKLRSLTVNDFYFGKVVEIGGTPKEPELTLSFGLPSGKLTYESLMRYAKVVDLPWGKGWQKQLSDMMKEIKVGDVLYVEVMEYDVEKHEAVLELMKRPRVNGGLVTLDKGEVRAVVSGFDTKGFNRAVAAKRQPGSVFKSVVFFGALQLGWNMLDRLDNERQVFPYQGRFYYPRPDHDSPYRESSLIYAGVMSENLASVSLTAKLTEKLNLEQFKQLMGVLDLLPQSGEAPRDFHYRVARATGVQLDNDGVREFQLNNAVSDLLLDTQFSASMDYQQKLRKMWYGRGYAAELSNICLNDDDLSNKQKGEKLRLAENNFQRFQLLDAQLVNDWKIVQEAVDTKGAEAVMADVALRNVVDRFKVLAGSSKPALGYRTTLEGERPGKEWKGRGEVEQMLALSGRPLTELDVQAIWGGSMFGSADISLSDVLLDGWLSHGQAGLLAQYLDKNYEQVMARQEDYSLVQYWQHHDFRIGLGLKYLVALARAMGTQSKIEPVLSFPLGANDVTVAEVAQIYQTFISGKTYKFYDEGAPNQINLIRRIEDRYGNVLFQPERKEHQLVPTEIALQMREILRRVVTHGTGRRAATELYLTMSPEEAKDQKGKKVNLGDGRIRVPSFGKTGTTNDYTNAWFAGFVPYPTEKGAPLDPENSHVIVTYVGYDLNKKMQNGYLNISGAQGALPAWIGLAKDIIDQKKYSEQLDKLDLTIIANREWPLKHPERTMASRIDLPRGVMLDRGNDADQIATTNIAKDGEAAFDEFRANVVQAAVRVPIDGSGQPLRGFSPFRLETKDKEKEKGFNLQSPNTPEAREALQSPVAAGAAASADADAGLESQRVYDENGNRDRSKRPQAGAAEAQGRVRRPGADSGEGEMIDEEAYSDPASEAQARPKDAAKEAVNPEQIFKDLADPDAQQPAQPGGDEETQGGFVEEELW
jgi:membrane peptidoglycan carboxypeptidase